MKQTREENKLLKLRTTIKADSPVPNLVNSKAGAGVADPPIDIFARLKEE